jgi:NAD(P)-dependent dehydrogenase (short-subunit alcohol dehydrogenase family)
MAYVVIIGANRGIGLEMTRVLAERGEQVVAACRRSSAELAALASERGVEVREGVDVTDRGSLVALAESIGDRAVDWLVVVAGILERVGLEPLDLESIHRQFTVNAVGPLNAVTALRPTLRPGSKIGLLTSRMGSIDDNTSGGSYGYRMSKAALNMAGRSLAHDLKPEGVAVVLLHPGWVRTEMTANTGNLDASEAARGLIARIEALTLDDSGSFMHQSGERLPW